MKRVLLNKPKTVRDANPTDYGTRDSTTKGISATHLYTLGGNYLAVMRVTDTAGESQSALFSVTEAGANPTITSAAYVSDQSATTAADLHVAATGTAGLTYTWSVLNEPANAPDPTYNQNADATAGTAIATFYQAGDYTLEVTAVNAYGGLFSTSDVSVHFNQQAGSVSVGPGPITVPAGGTYHLFAKTLDQFGNAMVTQPTLTWHLTGTPRGSLNANGVYTAPSTPGGTDTLTADSIGVDSLLGASGNDIIVNIGPAAAQPTNVPAAVTGVVATPNADGSVGLTWVNHDGTADGLLIEGSVDGGATFSPLGNAAAGDTTFNAANLSLIGNADYFFRVIPFDAVGAAGAGVSSVVRTLIPSAGVPLFGAASSASAFSESIKPAKLNANILAKLENLYRLTPSNSTWGPITLQWATPTSIQLPLSQIKYNVYRNDNSPNGVNINSGGVPYLLTSVSSASNIPGGVSFTDSGVKSGHIYNYWVAPAPIVTSKYVEPQSGVNKADLHISGPPGTPTVKADYIQYAEPAGSPIPTPNITRVRLSGGTTSSLPNGEAVTWSWSGSGTPTWIITRSDHNVVTTAGNHNLDGTWSAIFPRSFVPGTADPTVYSYKVAAMTASGTSLPSGAALTPQIYMLLGNGNEASSTQPGSALTLSQYFDSTTNYELHMFNFDRQDLAKASISARPLNSPVVLSGISFGGGEAVDIAYQLDKVDYLALFDPVAPWPQTSPRISAVPQNSFPYFVGYGTNPSTNKPYDDTQNLSTIPTGDSSPYSLFNLPNASNAVDHKFHLVITADDWYQDSTTELNAGGYNVATGKIDNLLQKSVVHESWSNTPVGTAHVSQIDPNNWGIFTNQIYNPASGSSFKTNVENLSWTAVRFF